MHSNRIRIIGEVPEPHKEDIEMKNFKNHSLVGCCVLLLLVSSVFGIAPAVRVSEPSLLSASPANPQDLSIDASRGDDQLVFRRKHRRSRGGTLVVIQIIGILVGRTVGDDDPHTIELEAAVTGSDAERGSLFYGLAWLSGDPDPLRAVRSLGYNLEVNTEHEERCVDAVGSSVCAGGARRLATLLDSTLALSSPGELAAFRQGASALGIAPDCVATPGAASAFAATPPDNSADMSIDVTIGDHQIALERKSGGSRIKYMEIKLKEVVVTNVTPGGGGNEGASIDARIVGEDRIAGSLLYALAWLAGDPDPQATVRALGYDIQVTTRHIHSCTDRASGNTCERSPHQAASLVDATLAFGDPQERAKFRGDAAAIGVEPQCSIRQQ